MTNKNLDIAIETWRFFIGTHPDADIEAVVKHIAEETRKLTLQEVGEWLEKRPRDIDHLSLPHKDGTAIADFERPSAHRLVIISKDIEALKRGEMPGWT